MKEVGECCGRLEEVGSLGGGWESLEEVEEVGGGWRRLGEVGGGWRRLEEEVGVG